MAEKRTKADKLQRSIERAEKQAAPGAEEAVSASQQDMGLPSTILDSTQLEEEIRRRAFQHYQARGCTGGHELDDWLQAEAEITHKRKAAAA